MNTAVVPTYQLSLVVLSFLISAIGSFVGLTAARRFGVGAGHSIVPTALIAGISLGGVGIWATHFVGMMAVNLEMGVGYSAVETLASLLVAIASTSLAFGYVARAPRKMGRLLTAGLLLGFGICAMHYLGMFGMRFGGYMSWSSAMVALSLLIAIVATTSALWLALNTRTWALRICAALIMATAVCAMHYTGMAAVDFICTTANRNAIPSGPGVLASLQLPIWVTMLSIATLFVIVLGQLLAYIGELQSGTGTEAAGRRGS